ncbi:hypothetical protein LEP1GSC034_0892 [Leptospira interrogans str. 2003000735]|uniref:Uncharacterized protein n=2 Tax=Leptospira interrogans TaxID=173 RepID=A0A829D4P3_LEPIR|nr:MULTISPECIES: hypothetical protein [Leptospira]EMY03935.1 hypothetical protein LEP1GSC029_3784 [Leptospira interrogans str. 2002000626]EMY26764.1 hypothetical protein LEP1GSC115_4517 [Leptospira interrogans serovar Australis str. 200703203]EKN86852.1 hypothetical protein LEP1GSC027_2478 [Leptospira interrogans str. 2002000624]EKO61732.1 hypothetical protein LEP1GSC082_0698 [Leptospira kirschneri str. H2]EKQ37023.1 hypothetical protein LEP1GSC025_1395 [Leptospira interrogans str. 2002000621]
MRLRLVYEINDDGERELFIETKNGKFDILAYDFKFLTEQGEQIRMDAWGNPKQRKELLRKAQAERKSQK